MDKKSTEQLEKIEAILEKITSDMATKDDIKILATKTDLADMGDTIINEISETNRNILEAVHDIKADRTEIQDLDKRVRKLERKVFVN